SLSALRTSICVLPRLSRRRISKRFSSCKIRTRVGRPDHRKDVARDVFAADFTLFFEPRIFFDRKPHQFFRGCPCSSSKTGSGEWGMSAQRSCSPLPTPHSRFSHYFTSNVGTSLRSSLPPPRLMM